MPTIRTLVGTIWIPPCNSQLMARSTADRLDASPFFRDSSQAPHFICCLWKGGLRNLQHPRTFSSEDVINSLKFFPSILAQLVRRSPYDLVMALWVKCLTRCHSDSRHGHMWSIQKENKTQQWNLHSMPFSEALDVIFTPWNRKLLPIAQMLNFFPCQSCLFPISFSSYIRC